MSRYLFLFTISPVQSFIAQARKTQDLYSGSQLLSILTDCAIKSLPENRKVIIFPSDEIKSKPNRFLALVETEDIDKIGNNIMDKVNKRFIEISYSCLEKVCGDGRSYPSNFTNQIKSFFQIYWLALEYKENQYKETYKEIEQTLGGIKNTKLFNQLDEKGNRKCSLCGERNALFYKKTLNDKNPAFIQNDAIEVKNLKIDRGEGLCAVCFTKRFYEEKEFPSTAKVALMETISKMKAHSCNTYELIDNFKNIFDRNGNELFNYQFFFEENLNMYYFKKHDLHESENIKDELESIKKYQKQIQNKAKKYGLKLSKYYAIIIFDGDSMGKWLAGSRLAEGTDLKEFHNRISKKLGKFAKITQDYLDSKKGKTVYAGGDDFLGLVSINQLFEVMSFLRDEFDNKVNQPLKQQYFKDSKYELTFSAGIAVAHYKTPLSIVLDRARKMEKKAKEIDNNKDAFAIAVLKRSGEVQETAFKWKQDECEPLAVIGNLVQVLMEDIFSNTFIKTLDSQFRRLMDNNGKFSEKYIVKAEIKRLVNRSFMMKMEKEESKDNFKLRKQEEISELSNNLCNLLDNSKNLENFLSALHIADFLKREIAA